MQNKLSSTQVCYLLNITTKTLFNWYKYLNETPADQIPASCPGLPPYIQKKERGPKFWNATDLHKLYAFQQWIPSSRSGVMANISKRCWSKKYLNERKLREQNNK